MRKLTFTLLAVITFAACSKDEVSDVNPDIDRRWIIPFESYMRKISEF